MEIRGIKARLLVDSGAIDTILSSSVYYRIHSTNRPDLTEVGVRNADGSSMETLGSAWLELGVGTCIFPLEVVFGNTDQVDGLLELSIHASKETLSSENGNASRPTGKDLSMLLKERESETSSVSSESEAEVEDCPTPTFRKIQMGRPMQGLDLRRTLPGTPLQVEERSSSTQFSGGKKLFQEEKVREYSVVFLHGCEKESSPAPTKLHHLASDQSLGSPMSVLELERALVGRVNSITEVTTRRSFCDGILVVEEEIRTNYSINLKAGAILPEV